MNIREIIDNERWGVEDEHGHYGCQVYKHNACLDRIEAAVVKRIAELELELRHMAYEYEQKVCRDGHYDEAMAIANKGGAA